MKRLLLGFGILAAVIAPPLSRNAYACVCMSIPDIRTSLSSADAVFSGQVIALDAFRVRFQVDRIWKGDSRSDITMLTGTEDLGNGMMRSNSCNYGYRAGQKYVVYANGAPDKLMSHACTRTKLTTLAEVQGLDAIVTSRKVGNEVRACSGNSSPEIRVTAANANSLALSGVAVSVEGSGRQYGALTDRSGKSTLAGLNAGEYKITASADGYLPRQLSISVGAGACVETEIYLVPSGK